MCVLDASILRYHLFCGNLSGQEIQLADLRVMFCFNLLLLYQLKEIATLCPKCLTIYCSLSIVHYNNMLQGQHQNKLDRRSIGLVQF